MTRPQPALAETHISWVLLGEDRAFKVPKPVVTDVVDQGDVTKRRTACEREVELNSRLSPDVYLGTGSIRLDGDDLEPVIVMRRLPDDRRLTSLLDSLDIDAHICDIARTMATFHASTDVLTDGDATRVSSRAALVHRWQEDLAGLRDGLDPALDATVDEIEHRAMEYLFGRGELLRGRIEQGLIRDGHGDLLADDIFCLDDGPRILDCLAFSDDLRCGDVLADLAFLVMDLQRLGANHVARVLMHAYCEFSDEHHPGSLAHLYVAQRALVRAKVTALRHRQQGTADGGDVHHLVDLTLDHLRRATVRMALVGGLPGAGKSTIADRMSDEFGWGVLSSDEIRRDLGVRYEDLRDPASYDAETVAEVYAEMRRRSDRMIRRGLSVVLDASWTSGRERELARAVADAGHADLLEVQCVAPLPLCRSRVAHRTQRSHSEATSKIVDVLAKRADAWPEALVIDTGSPGPDRVADALAVTTDPAWWSSAPGGAYARLRSA